MLPSCVSWKYKQLNLPNGHLHCIANSVESALEDIPLKNLLPENVGDFTMFLVIIMKQNNQNLVISVLKTNENTQNEEVISKGSYFSYYTIPSNVEICCSVLSIHDMFKSELFIEFDIENIFSKTKLNIITFPENTFLFN